MKDEEIKAIILLLESTVGTTSSHNADTVVKGVIALLKSKIDSVNIKTFPTSEAEDTVEKIIENFKERRGRKPSGEEMAALFM